MSEHVRSRFGNRLTQDARSVLVDRLRGGERPVALAAEFGVTSALVRHYARTNGISLERPLPTELTCRECGHTGALTGFRRDRSTSRLGYTRQCKACALDENRKRKGWTPPPTLAQRIEDAMIPEPNTGCWLWTLALAGGYPELSVHARSLRAHRVSYELAHGPIPAGMSVLHRCDTPPCVNPAHLFIGTQLENIRDCIAKGRRSTRLGGNGAITIF